MVNNVEDYSMKDLSKKSHNMEEVKSDLDRIKIMTDTGPLMKRKCSVSGCNEYLNIEPDLLYNFPDDPNTRQVWTNLTGRSNWMPNKHSYICVVHFSVDSFLCDSDNQMILTREAIPSLRLPKHVFEVEYIDEDSSSSFEDEYYVMDHENVEADKSVQVNGDANKCHKPHKPIGKAVDIQLLMLFSKVQKMQRDAVRLKDKLKCNKKLYNRKNKYLQRLKYIIKRKEALLEKNTKKKLDLNLKSLEKIEQERNDVVIAMPVKHTNDLKSFALSIYKYSPQAYIYLRNTLRTMLPDSHILEGWIKSGHKPRNVVTSSNSIKVISEQSESELSCKICIH